MPGYVHLGAEVLGRIRWGILEDLLQLIYVPKGRTVGESLSRALRQKVKKTPGPESSTEGRLLALLARFNL